MVLFSILKATQRLNPNHIIFYFNFACRHTGLKIKINFIACLDAILRLNPSKLYLFARRLSAPELKIKKFGSYAAHESKLYRF